LGIIEKDKFKLGHKIHTAVRGWEQVNGGKQAKGSVMMLGEEGPDVSSEIVTPLG